MGIRTHRRVYSQTYRWRYEKKIGERTTLSPIFKLRNSLNLKPLDAGFFRKKSQCQVAITDVSNEVNR